MSKIKLRAILSVEMSFLLAMFVVIFLSFILFSFYIHDSLSLQVNLYRSAIQESRGYYPQKHIEIREIKNEGLMFKARNISLEKHKGLNSVKVVGEGRLMNQFLFDKKVEVGMRGHIYIDRANPTKILRMRRQVEEVLD